MHSQASAIRRGLSHGPPARGLTWTHTQILPVMATWGHLCGLHMTATTATPLAVRTGLALNHPRSRSFHSSGTAESTSVRRGMAERLYFLAYFIRRALTFGGEACEVDEWVDMRSRTIADTQRRCSSDCDCGGGAIILVAVLV